MGTGTYKTTLDRTRDLTVFKPTGTVRAAGVIDAIAGHYTAHPTRNFLWDLTDADLSELNIAEFGTISDFFKSFTGLRGDNALTVFIARTEVETLLISLYSSLMQVDKRTVSYKIVASMTEALAWLDGHSEDA